jgi:hypothetical protein
VPTTLYRAEGIIKNVNTIEEYSNTDKVGMLQQSGKTVSPSQDVFLVDEADSIPSRSGMPSTTAPSIPALLSYLHSSSYHTRT